MSHLPTGTVTFLFTDVEGSTRLWERSPEVIGPALARLDQLVEGEVQGHGGQVVRPRGEGDSHFAAFARASDAVAATAALQRALHAESWQTPTPVRVRMALHTGEADLREGDYYGSAVNRCARLRAAAHGGQALLSQATYALARDGLPPGVALQDLGEHRLKDLTRPEHVFQLVVEGLPADFPPLATLDRHPHNLPLQPTPLIGREKELAAVAALLRYEEVRLVTLTGPGGTGKTRLALQAAADLLEHFPDGACFVDLAPVADPTLVAAEIARAAGVREAADRPLLEGLRAHLRDRRLLLLLDNFEQVVDAAPVVADLLSAAPQLKVLVTSRAVLHLRGERDYPVPPLALPDPGHVPPPEQLSQYEAVRLFIARAVDARPDFRVTNENAPAVAEICHRLDGLPLAIELAASRLKLFSPEELRERLRTRLALLRGGARDLPARQRTLRDTIAWSYELLDGEEQALFRLLSVFAPTSVEAVEAVAARLAPLRDIDVVERLTSLVDKSLVRAAEAGGRQRLALLETIREYAAERLAEEPGLESAARRAHAAYFADFAQGRRERLRGPGREAALDELAAELGNLLAAWRHWVDAGDLERLNHLLDGLWALHEARGWYHAAVALTNDLLGVLATVPETAERAREEITLRTSLARGLLALRGYTEEVEEVYTRALALAEAAGERPQQLPVLRSLASFYLYRGEVDKTAAIGRTLLELAEQQGDPSLRVEGHLVLGSSLAFGGDLPAGLEHLERAIALFTPQRGAGRFRFGPSPGVAVHTTSALLLWLTGSPDRAVARAARAVELAEQLHHPYTLAYALFHVGFLHLWRREFTLVHERAQAALEVAQEHDYPIWQAVALMLQGMALAGLGRPEEGLALTDRGVALYLGMKTPPIFWPLVLYGRAGAFGLAGRPAEGLALLDQALGMIGESYLYPELALLKGDLLLATSDPGSAELWFQSAFDVARRHGTRLSQLRAATRLTRLRRASGQVPDGAELLRGVYQTFTEGFETADLVEARAILAGGVAGAV